MFNFYFIFPFTIKSFAPPGEGGGVFWIIYTPLSVVSSNGFKDIKYTVHDLARIYDFKIKINIY